VMTSENTPPPAGWMHIYSRLTRWLRCCRSAGGPCTA